MDIDAKDFELKMTYEELWSTAFDVWRALEFTLETHWINHQARWEDNEQDRLRRLKSILDADNFNVAQSPHLRLYNVSGCKIYGYEQRY